MQIINLYADILANPRNLAAYQDLVNYYRSQSLDNEKKAFAELIKRKFNADRSSPNQEQRPDNPENT